VRRFESCLGRLGAPCGELAVAGVGLDFCPAPTDRQGMMIPMSPVARYDGVADWYDEAFSSYGTEDGTAGRLADRLGAGRGRRLLDVACGTGLHFGLVERRGWRVVGVDLSADQLRLAQQRCASVVRADGQVLPFPDDSFETVVATFIHTDVDDFPAVLGEIARVLVPGGRFVYLGLHPCFVGPFVVRNDEAVDRQLTLTAGYGDSSRVHAGSGGTTGLGLNRRVGAKWLALAEFLDAFFSSGLRICRFGEFGGVIVPWNIEVEATVEGLASRRPAA
jgi:SAM-dependent methyltransferase